MWSVRRQKSVLGRSSRMRPIASNYSEKLKHDSFVLLYFFVCFYFVLYFNTCVNIFVLLKAPGEEGPTSCMISLNSTEWTNKNYTETSLTDFVFAGWLGRCAEYACAALTSSSVSQQRADCSYTTLACMCRCIICKYGNLTFSYFHFFSSRLSYRKNVNDWQRAWRSVSALDSTAPTISKFVRSTFFYYCTTTTRRLIWTHKNSSWTLTLTGDALQDEAT